MPRRIVVTVKERQPSPFVAPASVVVEADIDQYTSVSTLAGRLIKDARDAIGHDLGEPRATVAGSAVEPDPKGRRVATGFGTATRPMTAEEGAAVDEAAAAR